MEDAMRAPRWPRVSIIVSVIIGTVSLHLPHAIPAALGQGCCQIICSGGFNSCGPQAIAAQCQHVCDSVCSDEGCASASFSPCPQGESFIGCDTVNAGC